MSSKLSIPKTIKEWKNKGYEKYTGEPADLELNTFIKYITKRDGELRALFGGLIIKKTPKYIILKNISSNKTWWLRMKWIHSIYLKPK